MSKLQKNNSSTQLFIDYVPAELKTTSGKSWRVVFYCKEPGTEKMKRFRRRVKPLSNKNDRKKLGKLMCVEINKKLQEGWTPFYEGSTKNGYKPFSDILNGLIEQFERQERDNLLRKDSLRSYKSFSSNILNYLKEKDKEKMFGVEFDHAFVVNFLDYIYYERKRSARTSNNYLSFLGLVGGYMKERNFIPTNPAENISKRKQGKKKREIIPSEVRHKIFDYLEEKNTPYLCLCLCVYFCFIRRTELTKLKVKNVSLLNGIITVPENVSKNRKEGAVTIPKMLIPVLSNHLITANNADFIFSADDYRPGPKQLTPKKVSDEWAKMRKKLNFKNEYQFYSLKDTGITELFRMNVPSIKIRDQARHYDISITEKYTARNFECDAELKNLDFNF